jgi:hypothetical protein
MKHFTMKIWGVWRLRYNIFYLGTRRRLLVSFALWQLYPSPQGKPPYTMACWTQEVDKKNSHCWEFIIDRPTRSPLLDRLSCRDSLTLFRKMIAILDRLIWLNVEAPQCSKDQGCYKRRRSQISAPPPEFWKTFTHYQMLITNYENFFKVYLYPHCSKQINENNLKWLKYKFVNQIFRSIFYKLAVLSIPRWDPRSARSTDLFSFRIVWNQSNIGLSLILWSSLTQNLCLKNSITDSSYVILTFHHFDCRLMLENLWINSLLRNDSFVWVQANF